MADEQWKPVVCLVPLPAAAMRALLADDLHAASAIAHVELTDFFVEPEAKWLWDLRLKQLATDPASAGWVGRLVIVEPVGFVVGHAGFHGPPDQDGMVEVGYSVLPEHRRKGFGTAILRELLHLAAADARVITVRASIRPDNVASRGVIDKFGFVRVGEQIDERDGLEIIFEKQMIR